MEVLLGRQLDCNLSDAASVYQFFIVQVLSVSFFPSSCRNRSSWKCYSLSSSYSSCFMVMDRRLRQNKLLCTVFNANWDRSYVYHITSNPKQIISGSRTCVQVEFVKHNSHMQNMAVAHSGKNSVKISLDPDSDPDYCKNPTVSSVAHMPPFHWILWRSVE